MSNEHEQSTFLSAEKSSLLGHIEFDFSRKHILNVWAFENASTEKSNRSKPVFRQHRDSRGSKLQAKTHRPLTCEHLSRPSEVRIPEHKSLTKGSHIGGQLPSVIKESVHNSQVQLNSTVKNRV